MSTLLCLPAARPPLQAGAFIPLPLGRVRPRGWLLDQLRLMADGLSGRLDEHWPDVGPNSAWLGGDGEAWERGPYFCDGLVPLAHLLGDERLLAKASRWIEAVIASQDERGQIGPWRRNPDWWARMVMLKVLAMHHEATGDPRVVPMMQRCAAYQSRALRARPLQSWAAARAADNLLAIQWLHALTGDDALPGLARLIASQMTDWVALQARGEVEDLLPLRECGMFTHGVNHAMGVKAPAVLWAQTGDVSLREAALAGLAHLMRHHGQPHGAFSSDEQLSGTSPTRGTELCAVVELMFSLEEMLRLLGEPRLGDHLERLAFNALPAAIAPDGCSHQYLQQVNQVVANAAPRPWTDCGDRALLFGLEPHFGCCTANMHQGWPKFAKSLVMQTPERGIAVLAWAPCEAQSLVAGGVPCTLTIETEYPFREEIALHLRLEREVRFPIVLRIPGWVEGARIVIGGEELKPAAGTFHRIERVWRDGDCVEITFPMRPRTERGHEGLVSVLHGPLLFGLEMGEEWRRAGGELPFADWEVFPTTPWNFALASEEFRVETRPVRGAPFDPRSAPVRLHARGVRLPEWKLEDNSAGAIAGGPHPATAAPEDITLLPHGATNLRVAAFPEVSI